VSSDGIEAQQLIDDTSGHNHFTVWRIKDNLHESARGFQGDLLPPTVFVHITNDRDIGARTW